MRPYASILLIFLLTSCGQEVKREDLDFLDGYWEIQEVIFPSGDSKSYDMNATIDYIETSGMTGYRKKVQPLADGSFITSDDAEDFTLDYRKDSFFMVYENEMSTWEEKITTLSPERFEVINEDQIRYIYRRYEPITLELDGSEKE